MLYNYHLFQYMGTIFLSCYILNQVFLQGVGLWLAVLAAFGPYGNREQLDSAV